MDVENTFLESDLEEEIYMMLPLDMFPQGEVVKLNKSLYGLKQAGERWNNKMNTILVTVLSFTRLISDNCIYVKHDENDITIVILYVDDIIFTGNNINKIQ